MFITRMCLVPIPQALGLLVEVQGRRFAHRAPAVLRLVLGVLRRHEAIAAAADDDEEQRAEQRLRGDAGGGDRDGEGGAHGDAQQSIAIARGWQEAYAALVLFEKIGQQVSTNLLLKGVHVSRCSRCSVKFHRSVVRCCNASHVRVEAFAQHNCDLAALHQPRCGRLSVLTPNDPTLTPYLARTPKTLCRNLQPKTLHRAPSGTGGGAVGGPARTWRRCGS